MSTIRGYLSIERRGLDETVSTSERIGNTVVGQDAMMKLIAGLAGGASMTGAKLWVEDSGGTVLSPRTVDAGYPQYDGTAGHKLIFRWTVPAGSGNPAGEGLWDDVSVISADTLTTFSEFLAQGGTLGTKGSGDEWVIRYELTLT